MLLTNQHIDKLTASHADFTAHGMLNGTCLSLFLNQIHSICFVIVLYLNLQCFLLGLNEANHDCTSSSSNKDDVDPYGTPLLSSGSAGDINDNEDDGDDGNLAGPIVEVHIDLAKIARKYFIYLLLDTTVIH